MIGLLKKSGVVLGVLAACYAGSELLERRQHLSAIHAEALRATRLFAWGTGMQGQLGVGTELMAQPLPREVVELKDSRLVGIVAANDLSAAIDDHGKIYTWGKTKGMMAQDHSGFTSNLLAPTPITFKGTENEVFVQVACGRTHMGAVTKDGKLYMWGSNDMGKLGIPMKKSDPHNIRDYHPTNYSDKASFCRVTGILETKKIVQIACGFHHTLCLTADGELFVWGGGKEGALGLGDWANHDTPMQLKGIENVKKICSGSEFSLVLTHDGHVFAWGRNNYGQLGITGRQQNRENRPKEISIPKDITVTDISCGEEHAAFLTSEGHVYTWGYGHDGQLGHGTKTHLSVPQKIEDIKFRAKKVVCGGGHTAVIGEQGDLYLFGRGRDGQLGKGDVLESVAASKYSASKVAYFENEKVKVVDVALGTNHSLALVE